ncbi:MAG TPA: hypothetical protein VL832_13945 [Puia sp.]|nr:hypothetical protein [Puia sp.]
MTMKMPELPHHPASFRDPSGFVFQVKGIYYRQISKSYAEDYEQLLQSGLYAKLTARKLLLTHQELPENLSGSPEHYKTLVPEQLELITYPYEWSFDQLKDAALHTLAVLRLSLEHDMILKDASPFNIQFRDGKPLFIDTLSFERYDASLPWVAYRQFCESFLFPLYLEHYSGLGTQKALLSWPDGIPAAVTARLLPWKCRWKMGVWMHVYLPAMVEGRTKRGEGPKRGGRPAPGKGTFSKEKLQHILQNLEAILNRLGTKGDDSTWRNYYEATILSRDYLEEKERLFREFMQGLTFKTALDIGANDGYFSHILGEAASVLAIDADAFCMNTLYRGLREKNILNIQPLCVDIVNPTPAIGFRNRERASFSERVRVELVVALALVHHLVFGRNLPLTDIPGYFAELTTGYLLVEFVPLEDEKVQELIRNKSRYHLPYDAHYFEACFGQYFDIGKKKEIPGTKRILYLMKKRPSSL